MAAYYTFEDLSGSRSGGPKSDNPYQDLIDTCNNDPALVQSRYETHRTTRNAQQKTKLLAEDFPGVTIDEILAKREDPVKWPGYEDPRNCLVFWARPTERVKRLIGEVQRRMREVAPDLWLMPQDSLHMTALEITHSLTAPEIESLAAKILPSAEQITDFAFDHRARLIKPILSFDAQALAISFLPAASEKRDAYTYHHLRRDLFNLATATGVTVASRYVIPSAHLTVGRFITTSDFETPSGRLDHDRIVKYVAKIEEINRWLEEEIWGKDSDGGEWIVGEGKGLDFRKGTLWYGGGETIRLGKGF